MAKGSRIITFRISEELHQAALGLVKRRNERTRDEPWTFSDFLKNCIDVEVKHAERNKSANRKKKPTASKGVEA